MDLNKKISRLEDLLYNAIVLLEDYYEPDRLMVELGMSDSEYYRIKGEL